MDKVLTSICCNVYYAIYFGVFQILLAESSIISPNNLLNVCCSVLQCSVVLKCDLVCFSALQCSAVFCSVLQCLVVCCNAQDCIACVRFIAFTCGVFHLYRVCNTLRHSYSCSSCTIISFYLFDSNCRFHFLVLFLCISLFPSMLFPLNLAVLCFCFQTINLVVSYSCMLAGLRAMFCRALNNRPDIQQFVSRPPINGRSS